MRFAGTKDLTEVIRTLTPLAANQIQEVTQVLEQSRATETELLTLEEVEVLKCVAGNMTRSEISRVLHISAKCIAQMRKRINSKLYAHNYREAVAIAIAQGVISKEIVDIDRPTKRQLQTLQHFTVGGCISYCAKIMSISYDNAQICLRKMRQKYGVSSNDALIALAVEKGWIPS
jgi:DNA-binding CsgD family transcriptional regulator